MEANNKFTGCDKIGVAPGCFDLPYAQALDLCETCQGVGQITAIFQPDPYSETAMSATQKCPECEGLGFMQGRMITNWMFTEEEFQHMVDHPEARGVFLSIIGVQHPRTLITTFNPLDAWPDSVIVATSPRAQDLLKAAQPANEG